MKAKHWIFNIFIFLVTAAAFVYLWKIETDWEAYSWLETTRRLVKVIAYGLLYVNAARVSYYCLKRKPMKKRFFVSIITSILLLACLVVLEGLMEFYKFEYFFGPAEGYNPWVVIVGDICYACTKWKAALWYVLALVAYPFIYVLEDIDIFYEICVFIKHQRIAYHQRALASLLDGEDYDEDYDEDCDEVWEEDEIEEQAEEIQVISVEDIKKLLDEMKENEAADESQEAEESQEVEGNEEPEEIQKPAADEIQ